MSTMRALTSGLVTRRLGRRLLWVCALAWLASARTGWAAPPAEYSTLYGGVKCADSGCHSGPPPNLPTTSLIVPNGSAVACAVGDTDAVCGGRLRTVMTARGTMATILASADLTDDVLGTIRRYLGAVRDGRLAAASGSSTAFGNAIQDVPGAIRAFTITNERGEAVTFKTAPVGSNSEFAAISGGTCDSVAVATPLTASSSCTVNVQFTPAAIGSRTGALRYAFNDRTGLVAQEVSISLSGTGFAAAALSVAPSTSNLLPLAASSHLSPASTTLTFTLSNSGGRISGLTLDPTAPFTLPAGYTLVSTDCTGATISGSGGSAPTSCSLTVRYSPTAVGTVDSQISIKHSAANSPSLVYLRSTGLGDPLLALASTSAFPVTLVGHPVSATVSVTNNGTAAATFGSITVDAGFEQSNDCPVAPATLPIGSNCTVTTTFNAASVGDGQTATLSVAYTGPNTTTQTTTQALSASARRLAIAAVPTVPLPIRLQAEPGSAASVSLQIGNPSGITTQLAPLALTGSTNFNLAVNDCGATLSGAACHVTVTFTPDSTTDVSSTLTVHYGPSVGATNQTVSITVNGATRLPPAVSTVAAFSDTVVGIESPDTRIVTIQNPRSNAIGYAATPAGVNAADFTVKSNPCAGTVAAGATCSLTLAFKPLAAGGLGARRGALNLSFTGSGGDIAPSPDSLSLSGSALTPLLVTTPSLNLTAQVTLSASATSILQNRGPGPITLTALAAESGFAADYSVAPASGCQVGTVIAASASCDLLVRFAPADTGARNSTFKITHSSVGSPQTIDLLGTGTPRPQGRIELSSFALTYPDTQLESTSAQSITVHNAGDLALSFNGFDLGGTNPGDYLRSGSCSTAAALAIGADCTLSLSFQPTNLGTRSATLTIRSDASNGPTTLITASGVGVPIPVPVVTLSNPSPACVSPTPGCLDFGQQTVGGLYPGRSVKLSNTGTAALAIGAIAIEGAGFTAAAAHNCPLSLAPGADCDIPIAFTPTTADADYAGLLRVTSNAAGSPHTLTLRGHGTATTVPVLAWEPAISSLNFDPPVSAGNVSATLHATLVNQGPGGLTLTLFNAVGPNAAAFTVGAGTCRLGVVMFQGESCIIDVRFAPASAGDKNAVVQIASTGTFPATLSLHGVGLSGASAVLAVSSNSLVFATTTVGSESLPLEITLTNTGSGVVQITGLQIAAPFVLRNKTCPSLPFTLLPQVQCSITITFAAAAEGDAVGTLHISSDANPATIDVALAGKGTAKADVSGGGCTVAGDGDSDPVLWALVLLAAGGLALRRIRPVRQLAHIADSVDRQGTNK